MKKLKESVVFLSHKRAVKAEKLRKDILVEDNKEDRILAAEAFKRQNLLVLRYLCVKNKYYGKKHDSAVILSVPKVFCFADNPEETVDFIHQVAAAVADRNVSRLDVSHQACQRIGLAAEAILGMLARMMQQRRGMFRGTVPDCEDLARLVWSIGTPNILGVSKYGREEVRKGQLRALRIRSTKVEGFESLSEADSKGRAIKRIINHLNDCLKGHSAELSDDSNLLLVRYLGEVIGNAEEHAGLVDWTVMGYLDNIKPGMHMCELAIFNFGKSIAQTFASLPDDDPGLQEVMEYVNMHHHKGFFGKDWGIADLLTVVALQGHVSCKKASDPTRGTGTVEAISVFEDLSKASLASLKPEQVEGVSMSIFSGSTQILLDGTYGLVEDGSGRSIIALNPSNDLSERPDAKCVKRLDGLFLPATVISIRFPLCPEHLRTEESS